MKEVLKEMAMHQLGLDYQDSFFDDIFGNENELAPMYVLTNQKGINGACCILYNHVLKDFAASLNHDLVLLPSSIHEMLILPYEDDVDCKELSEMVTEINHSEVPGEDQLSNQIYLYKRNSGQFSILSDSVSLVGASAFDFSS